MLGALQKARSLIEATGFTFVRSDFYLGRSSGSHILARFAPSRHVAVVLATGSVLTAAGPPGIYTRFPILPLRGTLIHYPIYYASLAQKKNARKIYNTLREDFFNK